MVISVVKRWGNSYGIVLPIATVREKNISENDVVDVEIMRKVRSLPELFGTGRFLKGDAQAIKNELKDGWND
jgi:antitoxin component of MazEF toxin-antitoxin module